MGGSFELWWHEYAHRRLFPAALACALATVVCLSAYHEATGGCRAARQVGKGRRGDMKKQGFNGRFRGALATKQRFQD
jgi:hypothetical protein